MTKGIQQIHTNMGAITVDLPPRTATVVVAASNALEESKALADYVCGGANDDQQIQAALGCLPAVGGLVWLTEGTYNTGDTIELPQYATLKMPRAARIVAGSSYPVVSMGQDSYLEGGCIDATVGGFSSSAILFDGIKQFTTTRTDARPCGVRDVQLVGGSGGYGIYLDASAEAGSAYMTGILVENVHLYQFQDAVRIAVAEPSAGFNFANGNTFLAVYANCPIYGFRLLGHTSTPYQNAGNLFIGCQVQAGSQSLRGIYLQGRTHYFEAFRLWDWPLSSETVGIEIASGGSNRIRGYAPASGVLLDNGSPSSDVVLV